MAKATIKSNTGAVITVEGTDSEVSRILAAFERTSTTGHVAVMQARETVERHRTKKREEKARMSASDLVIGLKEDGFFEKPKSLNDISNALREQGFLYPVTSLSGTVLGLVQKKVLRRTKAEGKKWVYGK